MRRAEGETTGEPELRMKRTTLHMARAGLSPVALWMRSSLAQLARSQAGVSLMEVVIAVALMGVVMTGLAAALAAGLRAVLIVEDQTVSTSFATAQLEDTLSQPYVEPADYAVVALPEGFSVAFDNLVLKPTLLSRITAILSDATRELIRITTHKVNEAFVASPPKLLLSQRDFRWYQNLDAVTPVTALAAENTAHTVSGVGDVVRLRMNVEIDRFPITAGEKSFKLQYATSTDGPWANFGSSASTTATWRGFDNPSVVDGATLNATPLLAESDVAQSYEEGNPSALNPNSIAVSEWAEWDWVVRENGAAFNTSYFFRMVNADGTPFESYTRFPQLIRSSPVTLDQFDYRWFANADALTPGTALAALRTPFAATTHGDVYRVRMNVGVDGVDLSAGTQAFKLQYATSTLGPWSEVGAPGSGATWRGFDNATSSDGATLPGLSLPTSDIVASYEEANPSALNPNTVLVNQRGEWDWVLQDNQAPDSTTFFFRMVRADGSTFGSYTRYPQLTTPPAVVLAQEDFRWFDNADSPTPGAARATENTALAGVDQGGLLRLRMNVGATAAGIAAGVESFKLQYATSTSGPWSDVGAVGSTSTWRGFDNPTTADGVLITGLLLTTSTVAETYEEQNPSAANPNQIDAGDRAEWDWVVENNGAEPLISYFFRMVKADGTPLDAYTRFPELTTTAAGNSQKDYRWYKNRNHQNPIESLGAENSSISGVTPLTVVRLRMNLSATGAALVAGSSVFKVQYATSTGGPWRDVGAVGSGEIWRGFDNSLIVDGTSLTTLLLTASDVLETYEEANPSLANPNTIPTGQEGEWDWVLQNNSAPADTYFFRLVDGDGTPLDTYTLFPELSTVEPALTQRDYRWYDNIDALTPTTALAAENTSSTGATPGAVFRIRMNVEASGVELPAGAQSFKLQFAVTTTGPWTDVGGAASTTIWTGFDNGSVTDGATITTLLSSSDVAESYEEENPSALNPNALSATTTDRGEWDWVVRDRLAPSGTFYFRMVKGDGSALAGYTNYPEIAAVGPSFTQEDYRWYENIDSLTPTTTLAATNVDFTATEHVAAYRLRMNVEVADANIASGAQAFKLQYATSSTGPWADVEALGSTSTWRGYDNPSAADGATAPGLLLGSSAVAGSYEEVNPSATNPNAATVGQRVEWDWVVQPNTTADNTTYFFRMVRSSGAVLRTYTRYPKLTTPPALVLTQQDYRWYDNTAGLTPTTPLAAENTLYPGAVPQDVFRLRMNVRVNGAGLANVARAFKLQFATTTTGPWTDLGDIGSIELWRGLDNVGIADGATLPTFLLASSTVAQSYEEENPSASNPRSISLTGLGEWDWVIEHNVAPSGTFYFRMVRDDGTPLDSYTNYPEITAAAPALDQQDYRWYLNTDSLTPTAPLAATNTSYVSDTEGLVYRLRMNAEVSTVALPASGLQFKLQYATSTGGPWTDVGAATSSATWRGFDNPSVADGATIATLLPASDVGESYEEQNPSVLNPNTVAVGQQGEWDWALEPDGAATSTSYFFRMVLISGTPLGTYTRYPELVTAAALVLTQNDYRWYESNNNLTPSTTLENENTAHAGVTPQEVLRIRMNVTLASANLAAGAESFKLQYATSTLGPWRDAGAIGSSEVWRGFDESGSTPDGAALPSTLLTTSDVAQSYEEQNPSIGNPNVINIGQEAEWDWVVQNNTAPTATFFFRMVRSDGTAFSSYSNYPEVTTAGPAFIQRDYRWFSNVDNQKPTSPLAAENTPYVDASPLTVFRLRVNIEVQTTTLPVDAQVFKLQFASTTTGPWTDHGDIGSLTVWRAFDNPGVADGQTLNNQQLGTTDKRESYVEENPSPTNPRTIGVGERGEWDWVIQANHALTETTFYWRVVKSDGTPLDSYAIYPALTTLPPIIAYDDFESGGLSGGDGWLGAWTTVGDVSVLKQGAPQQGVYHLRMRRDDSNIERSVDLTGEAGIRLKFWAKADSFETGDTVTLSVSDDGVTFTAIRTWVDGEDDDTYRFYDIDLVDLTNSVPPLPATTLPPFTSNYTVQFDSGMNSPNDHFFIDDLKIEGE